jgi:seryl-tRNA synthetase|tara:strand:+ start:95 stop:1342 length:1248 start_codon:yes stop_codon:yes gene_type:complete
MINIKDLREDFVNIKIALAKRGYEINQKTFEKLDKDRKTIQVDVENLQAERNNLSNDFGKLKSSGEDTSQLKETIDKINSELDEKSLKLSSVLSDINKFLLDIPNIPHDSVPIGKDEKDNVVVETFGNIYSKNKKNHLEITDMIDIETAVKIAGSRFSVLKGDLAKLQRALIAFMIDEAIKNGYEEYYLPFLANKDSLVGTGQLPKFEEDLFQASENLYLIPTAEVPLTNIYRDEVIDEKILPLKLTSHTPCFRSEAGSYGKDTKGLIRQHQFEKIELVQITNPDESMECLNSLLKNACQILDLLELPYQVIELCAGDLGFSSSKTFDIEVWMPSQNKYREISSCSNFGDFQARRSNIKINTVNGKCYAHTINGSALAVGRTLIALIENRYDGCDKIILPESLKPYMGKLEIKLS